MSGAHLVLGCMRTGCDAEEIIDLGSYADAHPGGLERVVAAEWPEDWGWDWSGLDEALHCPEHRS